MRVVNLEDFRVTPDLIAAGLETAFNAMLRLDPETQSRLAALEGCVIAIEPEGLGLTFYPVSYTHLDVYKRQAIQ